MLPFTAKRCRLFGSFQVDLLHFSVFVDGYYFSHQYAGPCDYSVAVGYVAGALVVVVYVMVGLAHDIGLGPLVNIPKTGSYKILAFHQLVEQVFLSFANLMESHALHSLAFS